MPPRELDALKGAPGDGRQAEVALIGTVLVVVAMVSDDGGCVVTSLSCYYSSEDYLGFLYLVSPSCLSPCAQRWSGHRTVSSCGASHRGNGLGISFVVMLSDGGLSATIILGS
jgi:hypothetical protein